MTFRELSKKEVVQLKEGACLGRIDDMVIDPETARVAQLLMLCRPTLSGLLGRQEPARVERLRLLRTPKLFGRLGRDETLVIGWDEIQKIGAGARLVTTELPEDDAREAKKPGLLERLLGR